MLLFQQHQNHREILVAMKKNLRFPFECYYCGKFFARADKQKTYTKLHWHSWYNL